MPATSRKRSESNVYHVMIRGVRRQSIYLEESDYQRFLHYLQDFKEPQDIEVLAYCLMTNHVHLLLKGKMDNLSEFMHRLTVTYAMYFNKKYEQVGHVFQGRFKSEPVDTQGYYNTVLRYIIRNPDKARIAKFDRYPWSSYLQLVGEKPDSLVDAETTLKLLGKKSLNRDFFLLPSEGRVLLTESDSGENAAELLEEMLCGKELSELKSMNKPERDMFLREAKEHGIPVRLLSRLTGLSRDVISRA